MSRTSVPGPDLPSKGSSVPLTRFYNRSLDWLWDLIETRTKISEWPYRPQPEFSFNPSYWTGALVAIAFITQAMTGLLLLFYYNPSAAATSTGGPPAAWASTQYIISTVPFGWLLLTSHLYGAYATIFLAFVHFFRGLYTGVYKKPREVSWMVGTVLLLSMLGMGFTGYLLPYTALSVGATDVGLSLVSSVPGIGPILTPLLEGNETYQGLLSRMFALHVVMIPLALAGLLYVHVTLFESHGIAPPASSDPKAKRVLTHADDKKLGNWFPRIFLYMVKWAFLYIGALLILSATFLTPLPAAFGSQNQGGASPEPDWYFLWLYKLADFQYVTPMVAVIVGGVLVAFILLLPWIEEIVGALVPRLKSPRAHPRDRPFAVFAATLLLSFFGLMSVWGGVMPGIVIPASMYASYLGALAAVDAAVVLTFYVRYRRRYLRRLAALRGVPAPPPFTLVPPGSLKKAGKRARVAFWDPTIALSIMALSGLLVPLGFVIDQRTYVGTGNEQAFGIATAIMAFSVAGIVHLLERTLNVAQRAQMERANAPAKSSVGPI